MNITSTNIGSTQKTSQTTSKLPQEDNSGKFAEELQTMKNESAKTEK